MIEILQFLIVVILVVVASMQIKTNRILQEMIIDIAEFNAILDALETALNAEASEATALAAANAQNASLQATIAAFNDPVVQQRVSDLLAKAAASNPPAPAPTPVPPATS